MKTENEINKDIKDIIETTMSIDEKAPEISKYLVEMPITIPNVNEPEINEANLKEYQRSLDVLLKKYSQKHIELTL